MNIRIVDGLPFVDVKLVHGQNQANLSNVLIDTGSASTLFPADTAIELGLGPSPEDKIYTVHGVGGSEYVFEKYIDKVELGEICVENLRIQVGAMDYGFEINGIIGMDFLMQKRVIIDTGLLTLHSVD